VRRRNWNDWATVDSKLCVRNQFCRASQTHKRCRETTPRWTKAGPTEGQSNNRPGGLSLPSVSHRSLWRLASKRKTEKGKIYPARRYKKGKWTRKKLGDLGRTNLIQGGRSWGGTDVVREAKNEETLDRTRSRQKTAVGIQWAGVEEGYAGRQDRSSCAFSKREMEKRDAKHRKGA